MNAVGVLISMVLLLLLGECYAQPTLSCTIDNNQLLIGDQRTVRCQIEGQGEWSRDTLDLTGWKDLGIEVLRTLPWVQMANGVLAQEIVVTAFDTGYIIMPPLRLHLHRGADSIIVSSNDLAIEVMPIVVDSTGLAPLKSIYKEDRTWRDLMPYILALLAIGLVTWAVIRLRRGRKAEPVIIEAPVVPPREIALGQLNILKESKPWLQGQIKEYQSELTHIVRAYLEGQFAIPALEMTTPEIISAIREIATIPAQQSEQLSQILNVADMIKFAKAIPGHDIHEAFLVQAIQFVEHTSYVDSHDV